jgi:phosphoglucomutase
MEVSPLAGQPAPPSLLVDVGQLVHAYYAVRPDPTVPEQRVAFGTSGHRGSAFEATFNEAHVLAIAEAVCRYRREQGIDGPLFLGRDTHALSEPAFRSVLEVLAAHDVEVMVDAADGYTPTPTISHAILGANRGRTTRLADGIVITPSHNPPADGGIKYDPPTAGPADTDVTAWIQDEANRLLEHDLRDVRRVPIEQARSSPRLHRQDYVSAYVDDLPAVVDLEAIRASGLRLGVDPLGGASLAYWQAIGERHGLDLTVVNQTIDPTFRFMSVDWDGKIRMDCSSPYAMASLIGLKDRFDLAVACDPDADRHGIVARSVGLLNPNHYLSAAIAYLYAHRTAWPAHSRVGKTVVSSSLIDRVAADLPRDLWEVPVGFKWFVPGLLDGGIAFGGEESAGASYLRRDGSPWATDKDGIILCLLAAEMTARLGHDPGELYRDLTARLGDPVYRRVDAPASAQQKQALGRLSASDLRLSDLAGEPITGVLTNAPGNGAPIGGVKVTAAGGWFAARPSGTEDTYKIYAESFRGEDHLQRILDQAQTVVDAALGAGVRD